MPNARVLFLCAVAALSLLACTKSERASTAAPTEKGAEKAAPTGLLSDA